MSLLQDLVSEVVLVFIKIVPGICHALWQQFLASDPPENGYRVKVLIPIFTY
jgi:hypothetical protein